MMEASPNTLIHSHISTTAGQHVQKLFYGKLKKKSWGGEGGGMGNSYKHPATKEIRLGTCHLVK